MFVASKSSYTVGRNLPLALTGVVLGGGGGGGGRGMAGDKTSSYLVHKSQACLSATFGQRE